jgi:hypothetical protein
MLLPILCSLRREELHDGRFSHRLCSAASAQSLRWNSFTKQQGQRSKRPSRHEFFENDCPNRKVPPLQLVRRYGRPPAWLLGLQQKSRDKHRKRRQGQRLRFVASVFDESRSASAGHKTGSIIAATTPRSVEWRMSFRFAVRGATRLPIQTAKGINHFRQSRRGHILRHRAKGIPNVLSSILIQHLSRGKITTTWSRQLEKRDGCGTKIGGSSKRVRITTGTTFSRHAVRGRCKTQRRV